jgi:hypothetical protein
MFNARFQPTQIVVGDNLGSTRRGFLAGFFLPNTWESLWQPVPFTLSSKCGPGNGKEGHR